MTPLQKVAMGLVLVLVDAPFAGYDGVPDPLGWLLVLAGLVTLRPVVAVASAMRAAAVCLVVAAATYPPVVWTRVGDHAGWVLSLPQLVFGFLLCSTLAPHAGDRAGRLRVLAWLFVLLALAPVVVLGGGVDVLRGPVAVASVAVLVYLVYLLFALSGTVTTRDGTDEAGDTARAAPDGNGPRG